MHTEVDGGSHGGDNLERLEVVHVDLYAGFEMSLGVGDNDGQELEVRKASSRLRTSARL